METKITLDQNEIEVLQLYADSNMSCMRAGKKSYRHPNTVGYHLNKIRKKTGIAPRKFNGLRKLLDMANGKEKGSAYWVGVRYDGYADGCPVYDLWECSNCGEEYESEGSPPAYRFCHGCGKPMAEEPIWRG